MNHMNPAAPGTRYRLGSGAATYVIVGQGALQSERTGSTDQMIVIYKNEESGRLHATPYGEFVTSDRFKRLPPE